MNLEKAGERVFENIDQTLAEKIISRSIENSKETQPDTDFTADLITDDDNDDPLRFYMPTRPTSVLKIAAIVVALFVLIKIFFRGKKRPR